MKSREDRLALARRIMELVSSEFGFSHEELTGFDRPAPLAWARQVGIALTLELTGLTQVQAAALWKRHHSTLSANVQSFQDRVDTEPRAALQVAAIRTKAQAFALKF